MKKIFKAKGMHCNSCEMLLKDTLEEIDGVTNAVPSFKSGSVEIEYDDSKVDDSTIKKAIVSEGFEA
jgi:copper chaperone CopZ